MLTRQALYGGAFILLVEEWLWRVSTHALARLSAIAWIGAAERWARGCTPRAALFLLVAPLLALVPVKFLAVALFVSGHTALGIGALIVDKIVVTGLFARIWQLTEAQVTQIGWVRRGRDAFLRVRRILHAWLDRQPAFVEARRQPRPMNGILVAITVMNCTFASSGRPAM